MRRHNKKAIFSRSTLVFLIAFQLLAGCLRNTGNKPYVARVDNAELTEEELAAARDSLGDIRHQSREYINNWVVTELLYQEAARRGMADTDELRRQLEATKKRLVIEALLDKEVYVNDTSLVNDEAIAASFRSAGNAFALREEVVNASFVLFAERDAANAFRSQVLRGTAWSEAILQVQRDSLLRPQLLQAATRQYFTQATLYPEELWKLARTLAKEDVSFVVKTNAGYYVLRVHSAKRQGEIPDLEYVRNEVRDRILIEQRRIKYEKLIAELRAKHSVDIRIDHADTTAPAAE